MFCGCVVAVSSSSSGSTKPTSSPGPASEARASCGSPCWERVLISASGSTPSGDPEDSPRGSPVNGSNPRLDCAASRFCRILDWAMAASEASTLPSEFKSNRLINSSRVIPTSGAASSRSVGPGALFGVPGIGGCCWAGGFAAGGLAAAAGSPTGPLRGAGAGGSATACPLEHSNSSRTAPLRRPNTRISAEQTFNGASSRKTTFLYCLPSVPRHPAPQLFRP